MIKVISLCALLLAFGASWAQSNQPPSDASLKELLVVMEARSAVDAVQPIMDGMMKSAMQQALKGNTPTPEQQAIFDKMQNQMMGVYKDQLSWEKMEPMYLRIYRASFTQGEVDGMLTFYRSPSGKAMVKKMPLVMQNTMKELQTMMRPMSEKIQEIAREAQAATKAAQSSSSGTDPKKQ